MTTIAKLRRDIKSMRFCLAPWHIWQEPAPAEAEYLRNLQAKLRRRVKGGG